MKNWKLLQIMRMLFLIAASSFILQLNTAHASSWTELRDAVVQDALKIPPQPQATTPAVPASKNIWNNKEFFEDAELAELRKNHKSATWTDPSSQLMWASCLYGAEYKRGQCDSANQPFSWLEARLMVNTLNYLGYQDWRLPTRAELATILHCEKKSSYAPEDRFKPLEEGGCVAGYDVTLPPYSDFHNSYQMWTGELAKPNQAKEHNPLAWQGSGLEAFAAADNNSSVRLSLLLVRGGSPSAEYLASGVVAQQWSAEIAEAQKRAQETAQQNAAMAAAEQANRAVAIASEQAKLNAFRRSLRPGSKCGNGNGNGNSVVLEVKANAVKVQTTQAVCRNYYEITNPITGRRECRTAEVVPTGSVWLRRDAIMPPQ